MKIAIATDMYLPQLGGVIDSIDTLAKTLRSRGHQVLIIAPNLPGSEPEADVIRLPAFTLFGGTMVVVFPIGTGQILKMFQPDVIHVHSFGAVGFAALWNAWRYGVPLVGTCHGSPADYLGYFGLDFAWLKYAANKFLVWFYRHCAVTTAPSESMLNILRAHGIGNKPLRVISNPIDTMLFRPLEDKATLKKKNGIADQAVLIFGRIAPEKNLDVALDAFAIAAKQCDAQLVFLGDGPYRSHMEKRVAALDLTSRSLFLGTLRGPTLVEAVNACDVLLITSMMESQGMVAIQSMLCELPVIAARAGALPEYIRDGEVGYLVSPQDPHAYAEKILELLNDPERAHRFGADGRQRVLRFDPKAVTDSFEDAYLAAIQAN